MEDTRISVTVRMNESIRGLADAIAEAMTRDGKKLVTRGDVITIAVQNLARKVKVAA